MLAKKPGEHGSLFDREDNRNAGNCDIIAPALLIQKPEFQTILVSVCVSVRKKNCVFAVKE